MLEAKSYKSSAPLIVDPFVVEHVFGAQETAPGGRIVRTIGIVRARIKIGLQNLAYNVRRLATLERRRSHASFNLASRMAAA